jgi:hypothetical protein
VVTNIAHISAALTAVMRENASRPDFEAEGSTALKPWFGSNQGLKLPPELDSPIVDALPPYDAQIAELSKQLVRSLATDSETPDQFVSDRPDAKARAMLDGLQARGAKSVFVRYLQSLGGHPTTDAVLAALTATAAWGPLMRRRISLARHHLSQRAISRQRVVRSCR